MNKNILITGGAGYIGSHISHNLIEKGYKVFIIDNLSSGYKSLINKKSIFYNKDIKNCNFLKRVILKNKIKTIMHLAASLSVVESSLRPNLYFDNNVLGTISLMKAATSSGVKNIIFSSTSAVYGTQKNGTISEIHPKNPISNYAITKLICEDIIKFYSKNFDINYAILRYFNVAGAAWKSNIGCLNNIGQLFKNISKSIINKKNYIHIYGNNYTTRDGTCIRDYIHVADISNIHLKTLKYIQNKKKSLEFNCGYGNGFSVLDIIKTFEKVSGVKIKKIIKSRRPGDTERSVCDVSLLKKLIKFEPKYNSIVQMVEDSLIWEKMCLKKKKLT